MLESVVKNLNISVVLLIKVLSVKKYEIIIPVVERHKDMLPLAERAVSTTNAIGNGFGEEGKQVEADTFLA